MARKVFFIAAIAVPAAVLAVSQLWPWARWLLIPVGALVAVGLYDVIQTQSALLRVYPVIGHGRYLLESYRPEIQQYFVETNVEGTPFNREMRSLIYQRAKGVRDTMPFGTQREVDRIGYEWVHHSLAPVELEDERCRVSIGAEDCAKPYQASYLNISAMSFGSLSKNAIEALNCGAALGGFAHNTGEGGISPYHLHGGDLIWQIGTGYFGCRTADGGFDSAKFADSAARPEVKMIELKLSQGAKPAHGGILPAAKLTAEIAGIRGVPMGVDVISPPAHSAFSGPAGLLEFVARLRELSGGKPVGFKLCPGVKSEFLAICKAMLVTGIAPDFIAVDGTEGGTGAAPVELSNSVGMPLRHGLLFVHNALLGVGLRQRVRVVAAGKIASAFDMVRVLALGADLCNSARGMMFALGCLQARRCHDNSCPVGVATQDPSRVVGLVVADKAQRVARYHRATIHAFAKLVGSMGLDDPADIEPHHLWRQVGQARVEHYGALYPFVAAGCLVAGQPPADWAADWDLASPDHFVSPESAA